MKPAFLLLLLALAGPLAAQTGTSRPHPDVPATMDVAGLHLVLDEEARRLVQQKADALCRHQPSFQARVDLADAAFPIIDRVLQQEGLPLDFRYLVLQESALRGDAQSIHDAVGYWQFKQGTATELGLVVNSEVDERRHLTASTRAAARYLLRSNADLQNWLNALLSYNTGLGGVKPYILPTHAGATEMAITDQTAGYVLMFLAQKIAFEPACGLNPNPPLQLREFPAVAGQSLAEQAQTIHADPAALAVHNRWLLAPVVPAGRPYTLIVPITDAAQAAGLMAHQRIDSGKELLTAPTVNAKNAREVRVNNLRALIALPNESKEDIARRGDVKLGSFLRDNELSAFDAVVAGRPYYLESKRDAAAVEYHVLQVGESIADIAQKYGMRRRAILHKNRLSYRDELRPGRVLWLQHTRPREVAVEYRSDAEGRGLERPAPRPAAPAPVVREAAPAPESAVLTSTPPPVEDRPDIDAATEALNTPAAPEPVATLPVPAASPSEDDRPDMDAATEALNTPADTTAPGPTTASLPTEAAAEADTVAMPTPRVEARSPTPAPAAPAATPGTIVAIPASGQHRVARGETLYAVARQYGLRPTDLLAWNQLTATTGLTVGQVLRLRAPEAAASSTAPAPAAVSGIHHTVATGETLFSISRRYGVSVADLQAWNNRTTAAVRIGEVLVIKTQ